MKLHNQSLKYLSVSILIIISIWAAVFYFIMLDEIHDSIDDGLSNYKSLIIQKATKDSSVLSLSTFNDNNYSIASIDRSKALLIRDHYSDTSVYIPSEEEHEPMRMLTTAFEDGGKYYELKVISSMVEEDDLIEDLFWSIVWLYGILIISILIINNMILRKLWTPFYDLLQQLQRFRIDKDDKLPDIHSKTQEFIQLKEAADILTKHALDAYNNQKQFTENAAHELQTPLAIITNKLELLLENGSLDTNDAESITQTLQMISRLTQLNKSLLLLSKIENKQFINNQNISLNQMTHQIANDLEEFSRFKEIEIHIQDAENITLNMDPTLAHILISNLVKNSISHNKKNGSVNIKIDHNGFKINNTAKDGGLNPQDIFKRFYKSAQTQQSTGLGLSIVYAICKVYGYSISYAFTGEHCFEVRF